MIANKNSQPQRILIVKLSAIGDVVQTLPVVEALRAEFPLARIDWVVEEDAADLLAGHPALDRVIVSRRKSWQKEIFKKGKFRETARDLRRFLRDLRSREYDWVIDNHGIFKSGVIAGLTRGRRKIGFQRTRKISDEGNSLFTNERYRPLDIERHALERYLDLIAQVGVPVDGVRFRYEPDEAARKKADSLLLENGSPRPWIVIHPLAKWPTKQWPAENFIALAEALGEAGASVVFTGSPGDVETIEEMVKRIRRPARVLNLAGRTNLRELAAVFSSADLVLSTDTGPMHLAAAVAAPLIALFGPTAPWRTGPYGKENVVLRKALACSPCFKKSCPTMECMKSLSVHEVLGAVNEKLAIAFQPAFAPGSKGEG